jgi:hypothetical protein
MNRIPFLLAGVVTVAGLAASMATSSGRASEEASPIYGVTIPSG